MTCLAPADQLAATTFLLVKRLMSRLVESCLTQAAALGICDELANEKISKSGNDYQRKQLLHCLRDDLAKHMH